MQRGLRVITLQGALEKSPILLSQYWKFEWLDGTIIILLFILVSALWLVEKSGQGQLTVKGSSNRMLPRFQEPILG